MIPNELVMSEFNELTKLRSVRLSGRGDQWRGVADASHDLPGVQVWGGPLCEVMANLVNLTNLPPIFTAGEIEQLRDWAKANNGKLQVTLVQMGDPAPFLEVRVQGALRYGGFFSETRGIGLHLLQQFSGDKVAFIKLNFADREWGLLE